MATVKNPCHSLTVNGIVGDLVHFKSSKYRNLVTTKPIKAKPIPHRYWINQVAIQVGNMYYKRYYSNNKAYYDPLCASLNIGVKQYMQQRAKECLKAKGSWNPVTNTLNTLFSTNLGTLKAVKTKKRLTLSWTVTGVGVILGYYVIISTVSGARPSDLNVAAFTTKTTWSTTEFTPGFTYYVYIGSLRANVFTIYRCITQFVITT
jgi:hypothetical protein